MATLVNSPVSVASTYDRPFTACSFTSDTTYLHVPQKSTISNFRKPEAYIPTKYMSPRASMNMYQQARLQTSKSSPNLQGDQRRDTLVDLLRSLHHELAQHRHLMVNIQTRLTHLEQKSAAHDPPEQRKDGQTQTKANRNTLTRPESQMTENWWRTCQKFAQRPDSTMTIEQFMGRKGCFSGFDFDFDIRQSKASNFSYTPVLFDVPNPSPASPDYAESIPESPEYHQIAFNHSKLRRRSTREILAQSGQDIVNQVVEVEKTQPMNVPLLQTPPQDRRLPSSRASQYTDLTALPTIPESATREHHADGTQHRHKSLKEKMKFKNIFRKRSTTEVILP